MTSSASSGVQQTNKKQAKKANFDNNGARKI